MRRVHWIHLTAVVAFAAVTALWLQPVLRQLNTAIPGHAAGDNVTFVWNLWWMRYVLHHTEQSFFFTPFLFYPFGVDLTLHTHTALPALAAALAGPSSLLAAENLIIVTNVYLNFICAYALAYRVSSSFWGALVAAAVFGASPFVCTRLEGHFNLLAAWVIPLVALLRARLGEQPRVSRAVLFGIVLGAAAYLDYYLFVYSVFLVVVLEVARVLDVERAQAPASSLRRIVVAALGVAISLDALVIGWILSTGGTVVVLFGRRISVQSVANPITFGWLLAVALAITIAAGRLRIKIRPLVWRTYRRGLAIAAACTTLLLMPLLIRGVALWMSGNYVSQRYLWRSAPGGIDAATFALGNPFNAFWGGLVHSAYSRLHVDIMEACGWISPAALILSALALVMRRRHTSVSEWLWAAVVFLVWSLGPWLLVAGHRSPLMLPAIAVRWVPIVANARMPGRAMVVVSLALAVLSAIAVAALADAGRKHLRLLLTAALVIDVLPARPPTHALNVPPIYRVLAAIPDKGAVVELPVGLRSAAGEIGQMDPAVMFYQTVHERPLVGGFVARLPANVARRYLDLPVLGSLLRLSAGESIDRTQRVDIAAASHALTSQGIGYIVLDERAASADLVEYVRTRIALELLAEDDGRTLYRVGLPATRDRGANGTSDSASQATK